MDPHQYLQSVLVATNRPGGSGTFADNALQGLRRVNPRLWELLSVSYTSENARDDRVRDEIIENWSQTSE